MKHQLLKKVNRKEVVAGIIGLGYVGLPLMCCFSEAGFRILGFDIEAGKLEALTAGRSYIGHLPASNIARTREHGFEATTYHDKFLEPADHIIKA